MSRALLRPLSFAFGLGVAARDVAYARGLRRTFDVGIPVVSVGNLTVGGTGKTPLVRVIVRRLEAMGTRPAVLLRGYGATGALEPVPTWRQFPPPGSLSRFGDEALEHARALDERAVVVAHADRVRAAAIACRAGATIAVLDDGFQHRRVRRNLDIVCLDSTRPLGRGGLLPAGDLREPASALRRADLVMWTRGTAVREEHAHLASHVASVVWRHVPGECRRAGGGESMAPARVVLAARVANVAGVAATAEEAGIEVVLTRGGRDHSGFDGRLLDSLEYARSESGADAILITAKDEPRLLESERGRALAIAGRVAVLEVRLEACSTTEPLDRALEALARRAQRNARPRRAGTSVSEA